MRAMVLREIGGTLDKADLPEPVPGPGQVRLRVLACGVCRTDLHVRDGDLPGPALPLVMGHQVVGMVDALGSDVGSMSPGDRVGVPWLGWTCGACDRCLAGQENLCPRAMFTGYQLPGGYAEAVVADARYCFPIPAGQPDAQIAPLLCAGLIGFRSLRLAGDPGLLGIYGFGGAAHILAQVARHQGRRVFAFTRPGDEATQAFARELGAEWAGSSTDQPPEPLDAAVVFAAAGELIPLALAAVRPGGSVVCAEIHMTPIPSFAYDLLWGERVLRSVANLTRDDGRILLSLAGEIPIRTTVTSFPLSEANEALEALARGNLQGSIVLTP